MSPIIAYRDGKPALALGLPGGQHIWFSCKALVDKFDHGLSVQEMVEAPRIWTQGYGVELEDDFPQETDGALAQLGHDVIRVPHVGGMNAIEFDAGGQAAVPAGARIAWSGSPVDMRTRGVPGFGRIESDDEARCEYEEEYFVL